MFVFVRRTVFYICTAPYLVAREAATESSRPASVASRERRVFVVVVARAPRAFVRGASSIEGRIEFIVMVSNAMDAGESTASTSGASWRAVAPFAMITVVASYVALERGTRAVCGKLAYFYVPSVDEEPTPAGRGAAKRAARERAEAKEMATTTVARVDLRFESLRRRILYPELDQVVFLTCVLAANGGGAAAADRAFGTRDGLTPVMAMFGVVLALKALFSAYMDARVTPGTERKIAMAFAFAAWMASTFVVFLAPSAVVDFRLVRAANDFNTSLERYAARMAMTSGATLTPPCVTVLQVGLTYSIFAAVVAGLLFASVIRVIKCYLLATQMPEWANKYAGTFAVPSWRKFILRTAFAAPLMSLVVSAPSMVAEPLGLSPRAERDARCGVLVVSGLCLLMSVHPLLQAYLDSGLITWYEVKEGNDKERLTETERAVVERQLGVTNHLVCKVALQIAAPALLLLSCGIGAWCYDSIDVTESALSRGLVPPTVAASAFYAVGWFACAWSVVVGASTIAFSQPKALFANLVR